MSWREAGGHLRTHPIRDDQVQPILDHLEAALRRRGASHIERQADGLRFRGLVHRPFVNPFRDLAAVGRARVRVEPRSTEGISYSVATFEYLVSSAIAATVVASLAYATGSSLVEVALTFAVPMALLSYATCSYAAARLGDFLREAFSDAAL